MFHIIIPARLSSSRLSHKILADLGGVPLVIRTAQQASKANAISLTVAVDNLQVADTVQQYGFNCILTDVGHLTGTDRLAQAVALLNLPDEAIVLNVQADEPMIDPELIHAVAHTLHQHTHCTVATAAHPLTADNIVDIFNPNAVKVVCNKAHEALYFSRAPIPFARDKISQADNGLMQASYHSNISHQQLPTVLRHIGIYAYRASFLRQYPDLCESPLESIEKLEQLRALWHGYRIAVLPWTKPTVAGVDTEADLNRV
ncbi:MAG: 3-deoxy-manno-octulosonate cytidylyltransferase, partial [Pseudomonadota bacterium]